MEYNFDPFVKKIQFSLTQDCLILDLSLQFTSNMMEFTRPKCSWFDSVE